jgi:hypothetical protein
LNHITFFLRRQAQAENGIVVLDHVVESRGATIMIKAALLLRSQY